MTSVGEKFLKGSFPRKKKLTKSEVFLCGIVTTLHHELLKAYKWWNRENHKKRKALKKRKFKKLMLPHEIEGEYEQL